MRLFREFLIEIANKTMILRVHFEFYVGLLMSLATLSSCSEQAKVENSSPNILFISIDDLRPDLGCFGHPLVQSPNIDKIGFEGSMFKNHFVQVPTCGASRAAMLTGLRPQTIAHLGNNYIAKHIATRKEEETPESFIHQLKRNGYYTAGIGKLSHSPDGFVYGYEDTVSTIRELPYSFDEIAFNSGKWKTGWNAFFGYADGENRQSKKKQARPYESADGDDHAYPDGLITELALEKLKQLKHKNQPFFLGVGYFKPHLPFNAPKRYWDLYERDSIQVSPNPEVPQNVNLKSLHQNGEFNQYLLGDEKAGLSSPISEAYAKKLRHAYYAGISYIDNQVGKLVAELEQLKLDQNTIIIIWGDHGWHLGDQSLWGKHSLFENALKSALIIKVPGQTIKPRIVNSIVETVDLYPTVMELAKVEPPSKLDGQSLVSIMKNQADQSKNVAYSYYRKGISLRTQNYRLTKYFRDEEPMIELYDHVNDPFESKNIAAQNPKLVQELMPILEKGDTGLYNN